MNASYGGKTGVFEYIKDANEALKAIELLKDNQATILGGDILSSELGKLVYANQLWSSEYHYLNWYSDKLEGESKADYAIRSYEDTRKAINEAIGISQKIRKRLLCCFSGLE